ncbi:unnamed protein product [Prunus armeniaca]
MGKAHVGLGMTLNPINTFLGAGGQGRFVISLGIWFSNPPRGYPPVALRQFVIYDNAPRVSGTPEPCGARIAAQADQWSPEACEECSFDGLGVSGTYEDCGSD